MLDATPLLRLYARARLARLARLRPAATQQAQLLRLVRRATDTRFGTDHGFNQVRSVADFQRRVPIRRYEDFWSEYWKAAYPRLEGLTWPDQPPYFALSSGTSTGKTKYIPVSREMVQSNRRSAFDVLVHHLHNRPRSHVFGGRNFMLGGSIDLVEEAPGIFAGDLTGIAMREVPGWARRFTFPPHALAREPDWERKIDMLARESLGQDIRTIAGTASWMPMFFDKLQQLKPGQGLASFYPNLELLVHGGVNFAPYRDRFERWLEGSHAELREVYPASEGFIAVADRGTGEGLRLNIDGGIFYEFVPVEEVDSPAPTRLWIADVETGRDYAVVLSNCSGAWAYLLGDTVRFVDLDPPRLLVTGRISYFMSAFGEHLSAEEIEEAMAQAARGIGATLSDYAVGAVFSDHETAPGGHLFVAEFADGSALPAGAAEAFARALDRLLLEANDDYRSHRAGDYGIRPPQVLVVRPGTFAEWMRSRGKLGGQNKVPRVITDQKLFLSLQQFAEAQREPAL